MIKIPKGDIYGLSKTTYLDKDNLGKTLYGFDSKSFHSPPFDLDVNDETNVMYYRHMHYVNDHCRPSYECWKNSSLWYRIKYRLKRLILRRKGA